MNSNLEINNTDETELNKEIIKNYEEIIMTSLKELQSLIKTSNYINTSERKIRYINQNLNSYIYDHNIIPREEIINEYFKVMLEQVYYNYKYKYNHTLYSIYTALIHEMINNLLLFSFPNEEEIIKIMNTNNLKKEIINSQNRIFDIMFETKYKPKTGFFRKINYNNYSKIIKILELYSENELMKELLQLDYNKIIYILEEKICQDYNNPFKINQDIFDKIIVSENNKLIEYYKNKYDFLITDMCFINIINNNNNIDIILENKYLPNSINIIYKLNNTRITDKYRIIEKILDYGYELTITDISELIKNNLNICNNNGIPVYKFYKKKLNYECLLHSINNDYFENIVNSYKFNINNLTDEEYKSLFQKIFNGLTYKRYIKLKIFIENVLTVYKLKINSNIFNHIIVSYMLNEESMKLLSNYISFDYNTFNIYNNKIKNDFQLNSIMFKKLLHKLNIYINKYGMSNFNDDNSTEESLISDTDTDTDTENNDNDFNCENNTEEETINELNKNTTVNINKLLHISIDELKYPKNKRKEYLIPQKLSKIYGLDKTEKMSYIEIRKFFITNLQRNNLIYDKDKTLFDLQLRVKKILNLPTSGYFRVYDIDKILGLVY